MLWLLGAAVLLLILLSRTWDTTPAPPLRRQPPDHWKTFQNRAAVHEAGHTVAAWCCTLVPEIGDVTIEAKTGGVTQFWTYKQETPESVV
jgi:hypothetical protein